MYANLDSFPLLAAVAKSGNTTIDAHQLQATTNAAKGKALAQMDPEDQANLKALATVISVKKVHAVGAETSKLTLDWINRDDPEEEDRLAKLMRKAIDEFIAAHSQKRK